MGVINMSKIGLRVLLLLMATLFISGCQSKVYLMPSPVGISPDGELFNQSVDLQDENLLYTLYATNRTPLDQDTWEAGYSIFPGDRLRFGWTVYRVGEEGLSWEEIVAESVSPERSSDLLLSNEFTRETATRTIESNFDQISSKELGYFHEINSILDRAWDKDILVYVHGANSNFYRATAQGAQFFHFTGHNTIILTFSWPSAENLLKYKTDVLHARKTVPAFAALIETLATHTDARNINILAYSAGAQMVAPGLVYLRDLYPDESTEDLRKRLRIGEVYFAAPDTAFTPFIERYLKFKDIVARTTINLNRNDSVLRFSAMQNGVSRLGRPDVTELDEDESKAILEVMKTPQLNILDVGESTPLNLGKAHDSWYNHPWVSRDILMLLLFNLDPLERGLVEHWENGRAKTYRFPDDYEINLARIAKNKRELIETRTKTKHGSK